MMFCPELNYWIYKLSLKTPVNEKMFKIPIKIDGRWECRGTVLDLLFNDSFNVPTYSFHYKAAPFYTMDDHIIRRRLSMHLPATIEIWLADDPQFSTYFIDNPISYNFFDITPEEENMLDLLLTYRIQSDSTDATTELNVIAWDNLDSSLSKMIYCYLQMVVNNNLTYYNINENLADESRLLELVYEKYLIDSYFQYMENKYQIIDSTTPMEIVVTQSSKEFFTIGNIINKTITLKHTPHDVDRVKVIAGNRVKVITKDYYITDQNITLLFNLTCLDSADNITVEYPHCEG